MALKTNNYVSKSTGIMLPTAYALLKNLIIESNNQVRAIFVVQTSRENASIYNAIDKVELYFEWDRKANPVEVAYEKAKTQVIEKEDYVTGNKVTEHGILYGWEDDIMEA